MVEPAVNGTMARIGLLGQLSARANCANAGAASVAAETRRIVRRVGDISSLPLRRAALVDRRMLR
jgi:hypothetical protein